MPDGTIIKLYSDFVDVVLDHGEGSEPEVLTARLRGRLGRARGRGPGEKSVLAAGDRVSVALVGSEAIVERRHERRSKLSRRHPRLRHQEQVVAANIDRVLVVASAERPAFLPRLIDRYLVAASAEHLEASLCITKCDLVEPARTDELAGPYRTLGVRVDCCSTEDARSIERLRREVLEGQATVLVGQSGTGKSTLRNALLPEAKRARTGEISSRWGKGRHITSAATFEPLPPRGFLVDTPGVREFGLYRLSPDDLPEHFPEFAGASCEFSDCRHGQERGCVLRERVERGDARAERLDSLRAIAASLRDGLARE